jgi:cytochrome c556
MIEIDQVFDNLKDIKGASWAAPAAHPDLVPAKEARRLADLFAALQNDKDVAGRPEPFNAHLNKAQASAQALAEAMATAAGAVQDQHFDALNKSCKSCHATYRDRK